MGVRPLKQVATEQVDITVTFDANGVPQTAAGQKQTVSDNGVVSDVGGSDAPVVSESAKANYAAALQAAVVALEQQIEDENYPNGDFCAYVAPTSEQATS